MRNSTDMITNSKLGIVASTMDSNSPRNSAAQMSIAPTSFNGCVSELSLDTGNGCRQDYTAAIKNYAVVYEEYQSYLVPMELPHDYDLATRPFFNFGQLGCLDVDLFASAAHADQVSDDDIESCGYMAWVSH